MTISFKQLLAAGNTLRLFALSKLPHPLMIEMFGLAGGYHGFWLDGEHATVSSEQIINAGLAARANDFDFFVRIPPVGYWQVTQCLEAGAGGVMGAQIHSAEHAEDFVSWCRFAPQGIRGLNVSGRDANYSHMSPADFVAHANKNCFVAIQIETAGALEDVEAIAALDGVDLLFIGPSDLSLSLAVVGEFHHPTMWEAVQRVAQAAARHSKPWGCVAPDGQFAQRALDLGCRMITVGSEVVALRRGMERLKEGYGSVFSGVVTTVRKSLSQGQSTEEAPILKPPTTE